MSWTETLPEELRDAPFLAKATDPAAALEALKHAANHVGNSLRLPHRDATDEDVGTFMTQAVEKFPQLMVKPGEDATPPPEAGRYPTLKDPDGNELSSDQYREAAFAAGLSVKQFTELFTPQLQSELAQASQQMATHEQKMNGLKSDWAGAYQDKIDGIQQLLDQSEAPEPLKAMLQENKLDADSLRWLDKWSVATRETANGKARDHTPTNRMSKADAELQIGDIMNDPAYWDPADARHAGLSKRRVELEKVVAGVYT